MTSILFLKGRTYPNQIRCNYLRNKNLSANFFLCFWNVDQILNIFCLKKAALIAYVFPKLGTVKNVVRDICKKFPL